MWKQHGVFHVARVARNETRDVDKSHVMTGWMCSSKELGLQSVGDGDPVKGFKQGSDMT